MSRRPHRRGRRVGCAGYWCPQHGVCLCSFPLSCRSTTASTACTTVSPHTRAAALGVSVVIFARVLNRSLFGFCTVPSDLPTAKPTPPPPNNKLAVAYKASPHSYPQMGAVKYPFGDMFIKQPRAGFYLLQPLSARLHARIMHSDAY